MFEKLFTKEKEKKIVNKRGRKLTPHLSCEPPTDNPKGYLHSVQFQHGTVTVNVHELKICDMCHKIVKLSQENLT